MPKTVTYPFKVFATDGKRPYIPVSIENPLTNQFVNTFALLDTGADANCFPANIPNSTGHNLKHPTVLTSINSGVGGGGVNTWKHTFIIHLLHFGTQQKVWSSKELLIDCVDHNNMPPLLGCIGFLCNFKITFDYKGNLVHIEIP